MLRCIWTFLSDPANQAELVAIWTGAGVVIAGIWAAYLAFRRETERREQRAKQEGVRAVSEREISERFDKQQRSNLSVRLSTLALLIALGWTVYWIWSEANSYCPDCNRFAHVTIKAPEDGDWISQSDRNYPMVRGDASPSEVCRYVYVIERNIESTDDQYVATDLAPTMNTGEWSGRLNLDLAHVFIKDQVMVYAILVDKPVYPVGVPLKVPPVGSTSNLIKIGRQ